MSAKTDERLRVLTAAEKSAEKVTEDVESKKSLMQRLRDVLNERSKEKTDPGFRIGTAIPK